MIYILITELDLGDGVLGKVNGIKIYLIKNIINIY
jgi:hypothetical protein